MSPTTFGVDFEPFEIPDEVKAQALEKALKAEYEARIYYYPKTAEWSTCTAPCPGHEDTPRLLAGKVYPVLGEAR